MTTPTNISKLSRSLLTAALFIGFGVASTGASADSSLDDLIELNNRSGAQLSLSEVNPGPVSPATAGLTLTSVQINQTLSKLDILGNPVYPILPTVEESTRTSTLLLYLEAKTQYETLWARCRHWAEEANDQTGGSFFPVSSDLDRRLLEIQEGSRITPDAATFDGYIPSRQDVVDYQLAFDDLVADLDIPGIARLDTEKRISSWLIRSVLDDFSARVAVACPDAGE